MQLGNEVLSFDHDYVTEIVQKRKEYNGVKKGVRFQTPFTRMGIHWETGTRTYNNASEVTEDLERRGLAEKTPAWTPVTVTAERLEARFRTAMEWQSKEGPRRSYTETAVRAKGNLQEFRRFFD